MHCEQKPNYTCLITDLLYWPLTKCRNHREYPGTQPRCLGRVWPKAMFAQTMLSSLKEIFPLTHPSSSSTNAKRIVTGSTSTRISCINSYNSDVFQSFSQCGIRTDQQAPHHGWPYGRSPEQLAHFQRLHHPWTAAQHLSTIRWARTIDRHRWWSTEHRANDHQGIAAENTQRPADYIVRSDTSHPIRTVIARLFVTAHWATVYCVGTLAASAKGDYRQLNVICIVSGWRWTKFQKHRSQYERRS